MKHRSRRYKLGLFVALTGVLTLAVLALLTGRVFLEERVEYTVSVPDAEGLDVGAPVKIRGVRVGDVSALDLHGGEEDAVRVVLSLDPDVRLYRGAKAYLEFTGVTGLRTVNIRGGDPERGVLEPGGELEYGKTLLDQLPDRTLNLLEHASAVLERTEELAQRLSTVSAGAKPEQVEALLTNANALLTSLRATSERADRILARSEAPIERTVAGTDQAVRRLAGTSEQIEATTQELRAFIARLDRLVRLNDDAVRATLGNLKQASQSFEALGRELRMRPSRLLFAAPPPDRELP